MAISLLLSGGLFAAAPSASGIRFACGNAGSPDARVSVKELAFKPAKRGFVRIAVIPVATATAMEIRFSRPKGSVFGEVLSHVGVLTISTVMEASRIAFYLHDEPVPRLSAESAVISPARWIVKGVALRLAETTRRFPECEIRPAHEGAEIILPNQPALSLLTLLDSAPVKRAPESPGDSGR